MSRWRRVVGTFMFGAFAIQSLAQAFHFSLSTLTGISSSALSAITFLLLPSLVVLLGTRDKRHVESSHATRA
jgi:hypothetical protein